MKLEKEVLDYIEKHREEAFELLVEMAKIPSPSHNEEKRAAFCKAWLEKQGCKGVYIDEALNVVYPVNCDDNPLMVFIAHSDIVFPDTEELPLKIENDRIYCPGVGDDTANIVAMLMAIKYITANGLQPKTGGILFVVNSCEEGLGNLKGSRKIIKDFGKRVTEFISLDGGCRKITNGSIGSKRYRIEVTTEGGHSFGKFGNRNAIHYLASLINTLYTVKLPENSITTYNVGTISGGTSVNTIAQQAEMLYEFRSDSNDALDEMEKHLNAAVELYRAKGAGVNVEVVGERPCTRDVDPEKLQALTDKADAAIRNYFDIEPKFDSGSTDCNIPLSMGIPAIAVGCYLGEGAHTREEFVEISSLLPGLKVAFELVLGYF
ncbi:MAG: M20/M25/M40 family metallo-hydrolase [Treponema sp.]|nr:M20/M25/M40 family metallo-hydrolase [Treponema sp.]